MTTESTRQLQQQSKPEVDVTAPPRRRRLVRQLLTALLVLALLLIGYKAARVGMHGWRAYQSATALLDFARSRDLTQLSAAQLSLDELAMATDDLTREMEPLTPILRGLKPLPVVGGTVAATPELLVAGNEFLDFGRAAFAILGPELAEGGSLGMESVLRAVSQSAPKMTALEDQTGSAVAALNAIPAAQLHPFLADKVAAAQSVGNALPTGLQLAPMLPELLGAEVPKRYLLLIQNNHELRATGGFISAAGVLTLDKAALTGLDFMDSYQVYTPGGDYSPAPRPMQQYMAIDLLLFRDANWSPDFPRSARFAGELFTQDMKEEVDGVISIDLHAAELIFGGLGPLTVTGIDEPVTADNVVDQIKVLFERPLESDAELAEGVSGEWWTQRKEFIPQLADAALNKAMSGNVDYAALMASAMQAMEEGAVQIWLKDEEAAAQMADVGWDGAVQPAADADFLLYVDMNMGYNKVDSVLERALDYQVAWPDGEDAPGLATVTMTYRHPLDVPGHECDRTSRYGENYDDMTERCYFDYVRLYAPGGSELVDASGVDPESVETRRGEAGTTVLSGYFVMEPGSEHRVSFTYRLPPEIVPDEYKIVVQRQSGTAALPLSLEVDGETFTTTLAHRRLEWVRE